MSLTCFRSGSDIAGEREREGERSSRNVARSRARKHERERKRTRSVAATASFGCLRVQTWHESGALLGLVMEEGSRVDSPMPMKRSRLCTMGLSVVACVCHQDCVRRGKFLSPLATLLFSPPHQGEKSGKHAILHSASRLPLVIASGWLGSTPS